MVGGNSETETETDDQKARHIEATRFLHRSFKRRPPIWMHTGTEGSMVVENDSEKRGSREE